MSTQHPPSPLAALTEPLFEVRSELRRVAHLVDDLKFEEAAEVLEEAVVQLGELHLVCRAAASGAHPGLARLDAALRGTSAVIVPGAFPGSVLPLSPPAAAAPPGGFATEEPLPDF